VRNGRVERERDGRRESEDGIGWRGEKKRKKKRKEEREEGRPGGKKNGDSANGPSTQIRFPA
jgi:hypothetical protein